MLKREFTINKKSLLIWMSIGVLLFFIVFLIYPSIMNSDNAKMMNEMINTMPEEIIKMFNMDIANIDTAFGFFKTEGYVYLVLILGLYSAMTGSSILLKEESEKTIEFLYAMPISRKSIVTPKIICGVVNIIVMTTAFFIINLIGMNILGKFDLKILTILSFAPLLTVIPIYLLCIFVSTYFSKTKKTVGLCVGISFISYILLVLSNLTDKAKILKYFSLYSLSDSRYIITNSSFNYIGIIISVIITAVLSLLIYKKYYDKEFI